MVNAKQLFVVDTTFILKKTAEAFHGAPLLVLDGKDHTFTYGFVRDLLRLRQTQVVRCGVLVAGKECDVVASDKDVKAVVAFAREMGFPVVHEPKRSALDICYHLSTIATHLVTDNMNLIQLSCTNLLIVKPKAPIEYECLTPDAVSLTIGVPPESIPTFIALYGSGGERRKAGPLTKRQAIRLVELYGDLESIYANLDALGSAAIREELASERHAIQEVYFQARVDRRRLRIRLNPGKLQWNIENKRVAELLHAHGFHSLVRLLPLPSDLTPPRAIEVREANEHLAVQDGEALRRLEAALAASDVCALDTESDDRDPRKATLLGVAFAVRKGEAFFVPLLERDLHGFSRGDMIATLNRLLAKPLRVVGHNIKYDALLLRRNGIEIVNIHFDTMLAAYDCYGDWDFFNLGFLAERLLARRITAYREIVGKQETFLDLPLREMKDHCCQDADVTLQLHAVLDKELKKRGLHEQHEKTTLALLRRLVEYEFQGLPVHLEKLARLRNALRDEISVRKEHIAKKLGKGLDVDSSKDLAAALTERLGLGHALDSRSLSPRRLEELAIVYSDVREVVEYKRLHRQLKLIEAIATAAKGRKIYPLFNQMRAPSGRLSSTDPSLFEDEQPESLKRCFGSAVRAFFPDRVKAIDCLQAESKDMGLQADRNRRGVGNRFMAQQPVMKELDHDKLLLSVVCGVSGPSMSRTLMLQRMEVDSICHDLRMRYNRLFEWLSGIREEALKHGYIEGPKGRKYLDGLKSSSVEKRKKASDAAVGWLIGY